VVDYLYDFTTPQENSDRSGEIFCPNCNLTIKSQQILKIDRFPKLLNLTFDVNPAKFQNLMPFCLESEIDLSYFATEKAKRGSQPISNDCGARSARSTKDSATSNNDEKGSKMSAKSKLKKIALGLFKKAEKNEVSAPDIGFSKVHDMSVLIDSNNFQGFKYQLNIFSLAKKNPSRNSQEVISYVKVKDDWFEFSGNGAKKVNEIEKLLQQNSSVPVFASYRLLTEELPSLEKEELRQFISFGHQTHGLLEKMFYIPDNFINRFKFVDASFKQSVIDKFCFHNKLLPDYHDVVLTKAQFKVPKRNDEKLNAQKSPTELAKNGNLLDGSFAALKYFATSTEIPLSLARKFIDSKEVALRKSTPSIETLNYFQTCKDCLGKYRKFALRRVLEKSLLFNFMKTGSASVNKKYLIDCSWFSNYRDFLIPDLDLFGIKKYNVLSAEPPTLALNSGVKQRLIKYRSQNKTDSKIANEFFLAVDKRLLSYLNEVYKAENCVMFDQKEIYIDNSARFDSNLELSVEEKYVLNKIDALQSSGCDFDQDTQMQLHDLNTKMNLYIEFGMDSSFKPLFRDLEISREVIDKYLNNSLSKFVKFVDIAKSDPASFDPCKVVFGIFNKSSVEQTSVRLSESVYFGANCQIAKITRQQQNKLNSIASAKEIRKCPVDEKMQLMDLVLSGLSNQSRNKELLEQQPNREIKALTSPIIKIQEKEFDSRPLAEVNLLQQGRLNDSNGSFYFKKETMDFAKDTSILVQSAHLLESNIIKQMDHSTLDKVYNNGMGKKARENNQKEATSGQSLIRNVSISTPKGRDSVSSTQSNKSRKAPKSILRRNLGSLIQSAKHINKLNESMGRDTIQLEDSFNYRFANSSFLSMNQSNRESAQYYFNECEKNSPGFKRTDFRFSNVNVLADLSDNDKSRGSLSEESSEPQRKDSINSNEEELENEHISEFASKLPKKSRFCNPRNIAVFRGSDNGSSEESQSSDDEITKKIEQHIAERRADISSQPSTQLKDIAHRNCIELMKSGLEIMLFKNASENKLSPLQSQRNVVINSAKKPDNAPKAQFVLNIVKDNKQTNDQKAINLSFSHLSSKSESEPVSKPLNSISLESSMVKSRITEPIQEENSDIESSDETEWQAKEDRGKKTTHLPCQEGGLGIANDNAPKKKSMNEISGKNRTPVKRVLEKENAFDL